VLLFVVVVSNYLSIGLIEIGVGDARLGKRRQSQLYVGVFLKKNLCVAAVNHTLFKSQCIVPTCHPAQQGGVPTQEIYAPLMTLVKKKRKRR
jgi:hypothetical protein